MSTIAVQPVSPFAALALHGLAHLPIAGPASLFDPAYLATVRRSEPLASDAPRIAAEIDRAGAGMPLSWLPRLHRRIGDFARTAQHDLVALRASDVDDPEALAALVKIDPVGVEWLRADLALVARDFTADEGGALGEACALVAEALARVPARGCPSRVRLARALGTRGRAYRDEVWVGAPERGIDAATLAVVATHEESVRRGSGGHASREWHALVAVAAMLAGTELAEAHAQWLAALDLGSVLDDAALGIAPALADGLRRSPSTRARQLASLAAQDR